ncbi:hypothetical protein Ngar_c15100 [Candidatus Nitrososphaera gargensis Ga9.2]|uniref:Uncharacterized protein n=1 Tax=Nitrososphaera gargensis (strain Ga9.2) TaxID=1237085 RepID=K0IF76_NITGG|nr:hypothetical protein Ngar_c15100 [Candidatus Nitrososphaera gargensis Ga9.2]
MFRSKKLKTIASISIQFCNQSSNKLFVISLHKVYSCCRSCDQESVDIIVMSNNDVQQQQQILKDGIEDEICDKCRKEKAELFQLTGEYCLKCWQIMTHPEI